METLVTALLIKTTKIKTKLKFWLLKPYFKRFQEAEKKQFNKKT